MFIETPRFPVDISYGSRGGPVFVTENAGNAGGFETVNSSRTFPLHEYDVSYGLRNSAQFAILRALFMNVRGKWGGFRYKDFNDFQVDSTRGILIPVAPPVWQLAAAYTFGSETQNRIILKPVSGTDVITRNSSTLVPTTNYTLDTTTGLITAVALSSGTANGVSVGSTTTISLVSTISGLSVGTVVTFSGFGGADAALVNGLSFPITVIPDSTHITIALNTTSKTITTSGSSKVSKFWQSADVLTAAFEYDVPCRFDTDKMDSSMTDFDQQEWTEIPLKEWRNPS